MKGETMTDQEWYDDGDQVFRLAHWLDEMGKLRIGTNAIRFFEEPWKWTREYKLMELHESNDGRPVIAECPLCHKRTVVDSANVNWSDGLTLISCGTSRARGMDHPDYCDYSMIVDTTPSETTSAEIQTDV